MIIVAYEIIDHGEDGSSYFPGCGVAFTDFDDVATGAADSALEAAEDALEQLCSGYVPFDPAVLKALEADLKGLSAELIDRGEGDDFNDEWWYYVSIRVKYSK